MSYIHHIPGRMRVRAAGVKRDSARCAALEVWLQSLEGVEHATVNALTGNALIYYRVGATDGSKLLEHLRENQWLPAQPVRNIAPRLAKLAVQIDKAELQRVIIRKLAGMLLEAALERCIVAALGAVL